MQVINYDTYGETVYYEELANGLKVYLLPKNDFHKTYASLTSLYGSLDIYESENKRSKTGIAHYLEHMLFNNETKDIEEIFNAHGAQLNAYTSINHTCYYYSTTNGYAFLLNELLDFVLKPNLNEKSLEKERLIILEELKMYLDDKVTNLVNTTLANLYKTHPMRYDIGGLISEVKEISLDELKKEHQKFYHPSNMLLMLVGNFEVSKVLEVLEKFFKDNPYEKKAITKYYPLVESGVSKAYDEVIENRSVSKAMLGFKFFSDLSPLKLKILLTIYLSLSISETSDLYERLTKEQVINNSFSYNLTVLNDTASLICYSDTCDTEKFKESILETLRTYEVKEEDFLKFQKKYLGATFNTLNNLENLMYDYVNSLVSGYSIFEVVDELKKIEVSELNALHDLFKDYTFSVIK